MDDTTSSIFAAIEAGDAAALRQLLAADPGLAAARNDQGHSALMVALYHKAGELVEVLMERVAELDLFEAAALGREEQVAALLEADADAPTARAADGFTALHLACYFGHVSTARCLLQAGADTNAVAAGGSGLRPIHAAAAAHSPELVALLLEHDADPDAQQHGGWTALHAAAMHGDAEMIRVLLAAGARTDVAADSGATAREKAAAEVLDLL